MDKSDLYTQFVLASRNDERRRLAIAINSEHWAGLRPELPPEIAAYCANLFYQQNTATGAGTDIINKRRLQLDAMRYIKWVKAGLITDRSPSATIADKFDVPTSTVSDWKAKYMRELPDAVEEHRHRLQVINDSPFMEYNQLEPESRPEGWVKFTMESSGRMYINLKDHK